MKLKKDQLHRICVLVRPVPSAATGANFNRALLCIYVFGETRREAEDKYKSIIKGLPYKLIRPDGLVSKGNLTKPGTSVFQSGREHVEQKWVDEAHACGHAVGICPVADDWSADDFFSLSAD